MATSSNLSALKRYITTNTVDGTSVFSSVPPDAPSRTLPDGPQVTFCYGTDHFPIKLEQDRDLKSYQHLIENPPGIVVPNGFVCRIIDLPPGYTSPMHRSMSVNFNVVIEGQLELALDSGEKRILGAGDSAIQRAINHTWSNVSSTDWARMVAVPVPAEPLEIGGNQVAATGIPGMGPSS